MKLMTDEVKENNPTDNPKDNTKSEPIQYDPNKQYKWEPTDVFYLSGNEFGVLLNSHREILNMPDARRILLVERANNIIEEILARSVEAGITKEIPKDKK